MKNSIIFLTLLTLAVLALASCMSDKEFVLRQADIDAKKAYPATYQPVVIKGPVTIPEGGEMVVTVPSQPYAHTPIPDGQAVQASLAKDALHTGAILGGAIYSIHKANSAHTSTSTTINNNAVNGGQAQ